MIQQKTTQRKSFENTKYADAVDDSLDVGMEINVKGISDYVGAGDMHFR